MEGGSVFGNKDLPIASSLVALPAMQKPILRVARLTKDKTAPAVRITRDRSKASGILERNDTNDRAACRQLDMLAYGADFPKRCDAIVAELAKLEP
jgi:hypothetical protein